MAPTVEMFAGGLAEVLVLDVTYMLAQTSLAAGFGGADVLHEASVAGNAVDNSGGLAVQLSLDLDNSVGSSGLHHSGLDHKTTDRATPRLTFTLQLHLCMPFKHLLGLFGIGRGILALIRNVPRFLPTL